MGLWGRVPWRRDHPRDRGRTQTGPSSSACLQIPAPHGELSALGAGRGARGAGSGGRTARVPWPPPRNRQRDRAAGADLARLPHRLSGPPRRPSAPTWSRRGAGGRADTRAEKHKARPPSRSDFGARGSGLGAERSWERAGWPRRHVTRRPVVPRAGAAGAARRGSRDGV